MKRIKVAVLMSTYNGEKYIEAQLDSILSQQRNFDLGIFIRDDASTDQTVAIIKEYQKTNENIHLTRGKNLGCNASFFELLKNVSGYNYYAFSDQDDVWMEDKLQSAINALEKENDNTPLLYGSCSFLTNEQLEKTGITQRQHRKITFYNTLIQNFLPGHAQVMNEKLRSVLAKSNIDTSKIYYYDSWITNVAAVEGKIIFDNTPHTYYRQHSSNEIGYGKGRLSWYKERLKRIKDNQTKKYSQQIDYFIEKYSNDLSPEYSEEIQKYTNSKTSFFKRIKYATHSKLYRQRPSETRLFKIMYAIGLY